MADVQFINEERLNSWKETITSRQCTAVLLLAVGQNQEGDKITIVTPESWSKEDIKTILWYAYQTL